MPMITNKALTLFAAMVFASLISLCVLPSFASAYSYYYPQQYAYTYPFTNSNNVYHNFSPMTYVNTMPIVNVSAIAQASATSNGYPYSGSYYPSSSSQRPTYNYYNQGYQYDYNWNDGYHYGGTNCYWGCSGGGYYYDWWY